MKNTLYLTLLCAVVITTGCEPDPSAIQPQEPDIERSAERKKKVKICHCTYVDEGIQWQVIKVKKNKVDRHLRHGDFRMKDKDKDGFYKANPCVPADEVDCDDHNKYVNPACPENPTNGIDDNCNGEVDEGGVVDADADGYNANDDCDDNNPDVNPGATETPYNGLDDDCDPSTLDDDLDQDGFVLADDCDDTDDSVNVSCTSCPVFDALNLSNITPVSPTGSENFADGRGFSITTQSVDESGNTVTAQLLLVVFGGNYGFTGDVYDNDGNYTLYGPLNLESLTVVPLSDPADQILCIEELLTFISPVGS